MKKLFFLALIGFAAWHFYTQDATAKAKPPLARHDQVILYGLTTCGFCKAKARELHERGIAYIEYDIDVDDARQQELNEKLKNAGFPPKGYGTPIFDVHGTMLPDNPDMAAIQKILRDDAAGAAHG